MTVILDQDHHSINVTYPPHFTGVCTLAIVARDSVDNFSLILFKITIGGKFYLNKIYTLSCFIL